MSNVVIKIENTLEREHVSIADQIIKASKDVNVTNIILVINSKGGDADIITPIWEAIKISKMAGKKIIAIGMIVVCSAAASIFMMADIRILLPNTIFTMHKALVELDEDSYTIDELLDIVDELRLTTKIAWTPIIQNSRLTEKILNRKCNGGDWILSEDELISYGIVTEKYDTEKMAKLLDLA